MVIHGFAIYVCLRGCLRICLENGGTWEEQADERPGVGGWQQTVQVQRRV